MTEVRGRMIAHLRTVVRSIPDGMTLLADEGKSSGRSILHSDGSSRIRQVIRRIGKMSEDHQTGPDRAAHHRHRCNLREATSTTSPSMTFTPNHRLDVGASEHNLRFFILQESACCAVCGDSSELTRGFGTKSGAIDIG